MRRLLEERGDTAGLPQSVLETRFLRLIKRAHLPAPVCQYGIREHGRLIAVVDFAYPDLTIAIEVDGYRWHSGRHQWQRDLARRNEITKRGWRVIHVTAHDIEQRGEATARTIAEVLAQSRPSRRPR